MNTGIRRIYYLKPYKIERIAPLLEHSNLQLIQVTLDEAQPPSAG